MTDLARLEAIPTHLGRVVRFVDLTPSLRQITLGGLDSFVSLGGDQFVHLLAPPPGRTELTIGSDFTWSQYDVMPESERPVGAYYSVRRWRPHVGEIDVWVVLHDGQGRASNWAADVEVGEPVGVWGPRVTYIPPTDTSFVLLVVDDTGLGAVGALLDELAGRRDRPGVQVIAETTSHEHVVELPSRGGVRVRWLFRDDRPAGTGTALVDAVRALDIDPSSTSAFGAGESRQITAVRRHLRSDVGLPADRTSCTGYWRR